MLRRFHLLTTSVCFLVLVSFCAFTRGQDAPATEAAADTAPAEAAPAETPTETAPETPKTDAAPATEAKPETPPATPDAPALDAPAPDAPAPADPAAAPANEVAAQPGAEAAAFKAKLDEWKAVLKDMRDLRTQYNEAEEDALVPILQRWNEQMARGEQLLGELGGLGAKAFAAAPNEDRELTRFLVKLLADESERDDYDAAAVVSRSLIDNGCDVAEIFSQGAVAAFCTNDFDNADKYFKLAAERGGLSEEAQKYLPLLDKYRVYWEEEQKTREQEAATDDLPRVKITTSKGELVVELFENEAPGAVGNFVSLVEKGFYDGLLFHRVLPHFMAQGGCPQGTGGGGPGYAIYCECKQEPYRKHFRGTLSMAHAGTDTGGSQFFMTFVPTAHLNGLHTAFGRVVEGFEVLSKLQRIDPSAEKKPQPDRIEKIVVLRKRDHEYVPNKVE
jgi:cyclophilin family peptidyl-prolyl cis-trans isomerase